MGERVSQSGESPVTRIYWPELSTTEQAFVVAYIDNSYSLTEASNALKLTYSTCKSMLQKMPLRKAIYEVQNELDNIDFLNEKWVRAQLMKLYPMIIGEEDIPFINNQGEQCLGRKFHPDAALKVIDYIVPKKIRH